MEPATIDFPALGSTAVVGCADPIRLGRAAAAVRATVAAIDLACSRFREDSELTAINRAAGRWTAAGPLFLQALEAALRAAQITDGDVDPTVGSALIALGYDRDFDALREGRQPAPRIARVPGWRTVSIDRENGRVKLARGVTLDFGATAKALAADLGAAQAQRAAGCGVLVGLGGDIALAGEAPAAGWQILVTDDHRSGFDAPGQWISLQTGGLATSSTTTRRWATEGGEMHHLVDPASGRPVRSPWRTVSVCAATCLDANIASTAAIIRGAEAEERLRELALPSRLVAHDGTTVHLAGWPASGERAAAVAA